MYEFLKISLQSSSCTSIATKKNMSTCYIDTHHYIYTMIHELYIPGEYMCFMTFRTNTIVNAFDLNVERKHLARGNATIITSFICFTHCWQWYHCQCNDHNHQHARIFFLHLLVFSLVCIYLCLSLFDVSNHY